MSTTITIYANESEARLVSNHRLICVTPPSKATDSLQVLWEDGLNDSGQLTTTNNKRVLPEEKTN